ncbi:MAG: DUF3077 domain-containing protein [Ignavibacteriales bacterium]|nr:DUF3077 domain-containing protein [Ignavibacteriales bacterium]
MHTQETPFAYQPNLGANLFSVRAGIPLATATEEASCIVEAAAETVRRVACCHPGLKTVLISSGRRSTASARLMAYSKPSMPCLRTPTRRNRLPI